MNAKRIGRALLSVWIVAAAMTPSAGAQVAGGTISGGVTDSSGAIVPGAQVQIKNSATGTLRTLTVNEEGLYRAPNLAAGDYQITASALGFGNGVRERLTLTVGGDVVANFQLQVGNVSETVDVTADVAFVETASSTLNSVVDATTVRELPLNGRDWTQLATLEPGVATVRTQSPLAISNQRANRGLGNQMTVSGNRPQQNNYRVDGISINDYSNGGPGSVLGGSLGVDAVQEFSVITSNAGADYGKTSGGVINAVSRSGSNSLHGAAYEFLRNSALDARNFFDRATIPPFKRNQFGLNAGGPIQADRTFIFADYEGLRQDLGQTITATVLSPNARAGNLTGGAVKVDSKVAPFLALYPMPNAGVSGDTGKYTFGAQQITHQNFFTTRADRRFSDKDSLFGTYVIDLSDTTSPDGFNNKIIGSQSRRHLATIEENHIFAPNFMNTARVGFSRVISIAPTTLAALNQAAADPSLGFVPGLAVGLINVSGIDNFPGGLGAVGEYDFHFNSWQFYDDGFYTRGKHALKFGAALERIQANQIGKANPNGQFIFGSIAAFLTNQPTSFNAPLSTGISTRDLRQTISGYYLQDDWHFRPNLTVNMGLRYEFATVPTETADRLTSLLSLTDATPHLGSPYFQNPTKRDFAPRVGLAWAPAKNGRTSVRGSFGMYDVLPMTYQFEIISILSAPFFTQGNLGTVPVGAFPNSAFPLLSNNKLRYGYVEQNPKRNYVMQWNLTLQHELLRDLTVQAGYVGSHGVHQPFRADDVNDVQPTLTPAGYQWPNPRGSGNLLNPNIGQLTAIFWEGNSVYHGLNTQITKRMAHGVQAQASFTWAKSIDDGSSSTAGDTFANSVSSLPAFDAKLRRGLSDFDVRRNLVLNYTWQIPSPESSTGPARWLMGGWQWGGIFQVSDGLPFTPTIGGDPLGLRAADTYAFPNRVPGCSASNPGNPDHYLNLSCFTVPASGTLLGNSGRNVVIGPGLQNFDMSLFKNNYVRRLSESFNMQFRAEMFNILNHSNFNPPTNPNRQVFNQNLAQIPTAGVLTLTSTTSRQVQFALKLIW
jgi:hypothetical protein